MGTMSLRKYLGFCLGLSIVVFGAACEKSPPGAQVPNPAQVSPVTTGPMPTLPSPAQAIPVTTASVPAVPQPAVDALTVESRAEFSLQDMQRQELTGQLRKQLAYSVGGGPADCESVVTEQLYLCPGNTLEPFRYVWISLGMLEPASQVDLKITYPQGVQSRVIELAVNHAGVAEYKFIPSLDDPLGTYQVDLNTPAGIYSDTFEVVAPKGPKLVDFPDENRVVLFGFKPFEALRLYLYQRSTRGSEITLQGWQAYQVDEAGVLTIDYPIGMEALFVAIGDQSGAAYKEQVGSEAYNMDWVGANVYCPGILQPQEIQLGMTLQVVLADVPVRMNNPDSQTVLTLQPGDLVQAGIAWWFSPKCYRGTYWYALECQSVPGLDCSKDFIPWAPETIGGSYALRIAAAVQPSPTTALLPSPTTAGLAATDPARTSWPVSETGEEACHLSTGDSVHMGAEARLWPQPDATVGKFLQNLDIGAPARVTGGPVWGSIVKSTGYAGWWYEVMVEATGAKGWVWQARITECAR